MKSYTFKLGEFFCGPGGLALGALGAKVIKNDVIYKVEHCWANDYDKDTCATYLHNICQNSNGSVYHKDVKELDFRKLQHIDAFMFGFPCNDFSLVGEQKGIDGVFGPLYSYGIKALRNLQPRWFLAENVSGLKSANDGEAFRTILTEMIQAGYAVFPNLYKFEEYGVPQTRHRIIIVGIHKNEKVDFKIPKATHQKPISAKEAIESPPIANIISNNEPTRQSEKVIERLKHIKPGENAFNANLPDSLKLNIKGAKISQIYKRLDPLKPSYTITGSGGGGTHVYHWIENRALTNRERARLQTFPDSFHFIGSKESVRKQIGMAVPPRASQIIVEAILRTFAGIEYPHQEPNISIKAILGDFA